MTKVSDAPLKEAQRFFTFIGRSGHFHPIVNSCGDIDNDVVVSVTVF